MYVVVEGIDGAGKSTVCRAVSTLLPGVQLHREPSDGPVGLHIRALLLDRRSLDHRTMAGLFLADRASCLPPLLACLPPGSILLSDRSWLSTAAYNSDPQGCAGYTLPQVVALHSNLPRPDLVVYLDCPVDRALQRVAGSRPGRDVYESRDFQEQVRVRYDQVLELLPTMGVRVVRVDASQPVEQVVQAVASEIRRQGAMGRVVMDYPTAWAYVRGVHPEPEKHDPACSWVVSGGGILCDCHVLNDEYARRKAVQGS